MAAPKDTEVGLWGELLSSIVQENGATGALIDGPTRDSRLIEEHEFPVWSDGHSSIESFGRVSFREWDVPVEIHGVTIAPGDVIFADYESIVVLDPDIVDEVIEQGEGRTGHREPGPLGHPRRRQRLRGLGPVRHAVKRDEAL